MSSEEKPPKNEKYCPTEEDKLYISLRAKEWVNGVIFQGKRVLHAHKLQIPPNNSSSQELSRLEEHFFVIAVNKSIEWLEFAERHEAIDRGISNDFRRTFKDPAEQVRNMREHDKNYFEGAGKKQDQFETNVMVDGNYGNLNGNIIGTIRADASSTIVLGEKYLIGGRLDLLAILEKAKLLYSELCKDNSCPVNLKSPKTPK